MISEASMIHYLDLFKKLLIDKRWSFDPLTQNLLSLSVGIDIIDIFFINRIIESSVGAIILSGLSRRRNLKIEHWIIFREISIWIDVHYHLGCSWFARFITISESLSTSTNIARGNTW
tara:strand:- start:673 stop:1026 length:354 start_codon:yes stop_codon:yes gene_type:complete